MYVDLWAGETGENETKRGRETERSGGGTIKATGC